MAYQDFRKGLCINIMVDNFTMQYYLCKPVTSLYKKYITRFRISAHNFNLEKGRYTNENRRTILCYKVQGAEEFYETPHKHPPNPMYQYNTYPK